MDSAASTRVFIVDDAPAVVDRIREYVAGIPGAVVVGEAASAADAVAGIARTDPSCVLLDYRLVDGTGLDVLRALRAGRRDVVFIVLTNQVEAHYRRLCLAAGANHYLDKSTEFHRVGQLIRAMGAGVPPRP